MRRIDLIGAFILIVWGGILVLKPNLFVRGIWKRTNIAQRLLSPKSYLVYTRTLGLFFILAGFVWLAVAPTRNPDSPRQTAPSTTTSNQTLERTADRREDLLSMASTLNPEAVLALVSGRSAYSR